LKTLALYNIKGGVGKTTAAVNLAYLAAKSGANTLVWDLDPQGASSFYFRIKPKVKGGSKQLIAGKREIDELIKGTDYDNLDLLPADFSFRNLDIILDDEKKSTSRLNKLIKPLKTQYDYIFLDCPPNISLLSECVFNAANTLISPVIPTTLSLRTLEQLQKFIHKNNPKTLQLMPFFSMVDRRKRLHREILESLPKSVPSFLNTAIPYASDVEKMGLERSALFSFKPKSRSAHAYRALWEEIEERLL